MTGTGRHEEHGPGIRWLAGRTGRAPEELTGSPAAAASALGAAMREIGALAARLESPDPGVRAAAQVEADRLRAEFHAAPPPGEVFGRGVAEVVRETAERLRNGPHGPPSAPTN